MDPYFEKHCQQLGRACAQAKMRLDKKAPLAYQDAFQSYRGPKTFPTYFERKCLSLGLSAIKRGMVLDPVVDARFIEEITPGFCPVTLEMFDTQGKSPKNPSVDRLVNEGTYAAGNIAMLSIRANRAKGDKTFEAVTEIATKGEAQEGLEGIEWMRLATLMYGAWSVAVADADPYLLPLATYPGPKMFSSQSQLVQWLLLRHCLNEAWPDSMNIWLQVTRDASYPSDDFLRFAYRLRAAASEETFEPTAWLYPEVFDGFRVWYNACSSTISPLMQGLLAKYQTGVDVDAFTQNWHVGSRYRA